MAWKSCSYCEMPIQGYCGRCAKSFCTGHARDHWVHQTLEVSPHLRDQLEQLMDGVLEPEPDEAPPRS